MLKPRHMAFLPFQMDDRINRSPSDLPASAKICRRKGMDAVPPGCQGTGAAAPVRLKLRNDPECPCADMKAPWEGPGTAGGVDDNKFIPLDIDTVLRQTQDERGLARAFWPDDHDPLPGDGGKTGMNPQVWGVGAIGLFMDKGVKRMQDSLRIQTGSAGNAVFKDIEGPGMFSNPVQSAGLRGNILQGVNGQVGKGRADGRRVGVDFDLAVQQLKAYRRDPAFPPARRGGVIPDGGRNQSWWCGHGCFPSKRFHKRQRYLQSIRRHRIRPA